MPLSHRPSRPYGLFMRTVLDSENPCGVGGSVTPAEQTAPQGCYVNPILDDAFPDPAVILADDGYYYAYATQTLRDGKWINIQVARSLDLIHWDHVGDALPKKPEWAKTTQDFWAPTVIY